MFTNYYFLSKDGIRRTISLQTLDDVIRITLFHNDEVVDTMDIKERKPVNMGEESEYYIKINNFSYDIKYIQDGKEMNFAKIKKNEVSKKIRDYIDGPPVQYNFTMIGVGIFLVSLSGLLYFYFPQSSSLIIRALPFATAFIGGYIIAFQLFQKDNMIGKSKSRLAFALGIAIGFLILSEKLVGTTGNIPTDSPTTQAVITEVNYHVTKQYKSRNIDPHYTHDYSFEVESKTYTGYISAPTETYSIGDTVTVIYRADAPQFNKGY